jgi:hypothetical protein
MAKEWQTFVRKFEDMEEGERELFVKDLTAGTHKYDTKHVRARVSKSRDKMADGEVIWIRSESGLMASEPWYMEILEELSDFVSGRPWEDVLDVIKKKNKG